MNKIISYIVEPKKIILYLMNKNYLSFIPDETFLKMKYKLMMGTKLDLENPKTFNEKLQWLKLHDRNPEYTKMVDKYEAKEYVANIIGKEYIIPTLGVWDKFDDIDFDALPNEFVLKPTHTSGNVFICKDKSKIDYKKLKKQVNKWLKRDYYRIHREWPYKNVKPRIIAEKYMENFNDEELKDYKLMCFNGKVKFAFTCTDRYSEDGLKVTFFDLNWHKLPFERHYPSSNKYIEEPKNYEFMKKLAEELSQDIPFVRVDFYEINGKIYFGELTFYPGAGFEEFNPEIWDQKIGDMLELPKEKKIEK